MDFGDDRRQTAALAALAAAGGLAIGANRHKVIELLSLPVQWVGKTAGAAFGGALRFVVQQKEALEDKIAEARVKTVIQ